MLQTYKFKIKFLLYVKLITYALVHINTEDDIRLYVKTYGKTYDAIKYIPLLI